MWCNPGSDQVRELCLLAQGAGKFHLWGEAGVLEDEEVVRNPVLSFNTRLLTVYNEFCSFLSLLMLLKIHFTVVRDPFAWVCCVHTCLSWNWVWISLHTWSNCDNILIFSTSSCKLEFHPQRSTPSILKAPAPFYSSISIKLENALTDFTRWGSLYNSKSCLKISLQYCSADLLVVPLLLAATSWFPAKMGQAGTWNCLPFILSR